MAQPYLVTKNLGNHLGNRRGQGEVRVCFEESAWADRGDSGSLENFCFEDYEAPLTPLGLYLQPSSLRCT